MFTGIVTDTTTIESSRKTAQGLSLQFKKPKGWTDLRPGDSIATDGVCLTAATVAPAHYSCELMPETLERTSFGRSLPQAVNLERSLRLDGRLDGHWVQGHVDTVGIVTGVDRSDGWRTTIEFPVEYRDLVVAKGAITVNGVSLTVTKVTNQSFEVALVPYTLAHTTLVNLEGGAAVNLEFDIMGKYAARLLHQ